MVVSEVNHPFDPVDKIVNVLKKQGVGITTIYESKKERAILDEEFVEFGPIKRNINEFFNLYDTKFYDIAKRPTHKFFSGMYLAYFSYQ